MYGMSLLENYKIYDRKFFTNRQRMFDYILFSPEMVEETRVIFLASTPYLSISYYVTQYRLWASLSRAPICMVCLFSKTIRHMIEIS